MANSSVLGGERGHPLPGIGAKVGSAVLDHGRAHPAHAGAAGCRLGA
ncbi:hypothetical protein [Nocardia neocaledoniensis]|nr:hypothetical protein [Nocardia neocaledoniensis]